MSGIHTKLMAGLLGAISTPSFAMDIYQNSGMTFKGTTGLLVVPTADVVEYGALGYGVNNFLFPGYPTELEAENYFFTAGVWKGFEAQIGLNETHRKGADPDKYGDFYKRDLVGNAKYSVSLFDSRLKLAVGGQDLSGLAVYSQRYYAVGTYSHELGAISLGYASNSNDSNNPNSADHLEGLFGGVQVDLPYGLSAIAEYDGFYKRGGIRYRASNLLGSRVHLNAQASLVSDALEEDSVLGLSLVIPLGAKASEVAESIAAEVRRDNEALQADISEYQVYYPDSSDAETHSAVVLKESPVEDIPESTLNSTMIVNLSAVSDAQQEEKKQESQTNDLATQLEESGVQFVAIKENTESLLIRYQNRLFDWSEQDALAQVIAFAAPYAYEKGFANLEIEVWSEQNPVLRVQLSPAWALDKPINQARKPRYFEPHFEQASLFSSQNSDWDVENGRKEWISVKVKPAIVNTIGSEVGVYHYSLGVNTEVSAELWKGGRISIDRNDLLRNSSQFEDGGYFDDYAIESDFAQAVLQQTLVPIKGLVNTISYHYPLKEGRKSYKVVDEWRYYAFGGRHQLYGYGAYNWSDVTSSSYQDDYFYGYNGYEFFWPEQDLAFNVERGKYINEDMTTKLTMKSYIGDSQFRASWIREDSGYEKVYVNVTLPLTTRKALQLGPVSVRGESKWSYGIQTIIDDPNSTGVNLNLGDSRYRPFGFYVTQPYEPHDSVMDSGRLTPIFMENSKKLLKTNIRKWLK